MTNGTLATTSDVPTGESGDGLVARVAFYQAYLDDPAQLSRIFPGHELGQKPGQRYIAPLPGMQFCLVAKAGDKALNSSILSFVKGVPLGYPNDMTVFAIGSSTSPLLGAWGAQEARGECYPLRDEQRRHPVPLGSPLVAGDWRQLGPDACCLVFAMALPNGREAGSFKEELIGRVLQKLGGPPEGLRGLGSFAQGLGIYLAELWESPKLNEIFRESTLKPVFHDMDLGEPPRRFLFPELLAVSAGDDLVAVGNGA